MGHLVSVQMINHVIHGRQQRKKVGSADQVVVLIQGPEAQVLTAVAESLVSSREMRVRDFVLQPIVIL